MRKLVVIGLMTAMVVATFAFIANAAQVTLAWDANTDPAVAGYKLYYGTAPRTYGTPVDVGKVTQYTLTGIQEGVNLYFAVTAYDSSGNESEFSTELECYTLVPAAAVNGTINPSSAVVVSRGMSQTFTVAPTAPNNSVEVFVDGISVGGATSYTFSNVTANHVISANFSVVITGEPLVDEDIAVSAWTRLTRNSPIPVKVVNYDGTGRTALIFSPGSLSEAKFMLTLGRVVNGNSEMAGMKWTFKVLNEYDVSSPKSSFYFTVKTSASSTPRNIFYCLASGPYPPSTLTSIVQDLGSMFWVYGATGVFEEIVVNLQDDLQEQEAQRYNTVTEIQSVTVIARQTIILLCY